MMYSPLRNRSTTERTSTLATYRQNYAKHGEAEKEDNDKVLLPHYPSNHKQKYAEPKSTTRTNKKNKSVYEDKKTHDKIISTVPQDTILLHNKLNKKKMKLRQLKSEITNIKKDATFKVKQLEKSISTLAKDTGSTNVAIIGKLMKEKESLIAQNLAIQKELTILKNDTTYSQLRINELTDQLNYYKEQAQAKIDMPKYEYEARIKTVIDKITTALNKSQDSMINEISLNANIESMETAVDYLLKAKEYSEQKYNKLLALHEMVTDGENGINPNIYKVMDENEVLKKKITEMQTTQSIDEVSNKHNRINSEEKSDLLSKIEMLEKKLFELEDLQKSSKKKPKKIKNNIRHSYHE